MQAQPAAGVAVALALGLVPLWTFGEMVDGAAQVALFTVCSATMQGCWKTRSETVLIAEGKSDEFSVGRSS